MSESAGRWCRCGAVRIRKATMSARLDGGVMKSEFIEQAGCGHEAGRIGTGQTITWVVVLVTADWIALEQRLQHRADGNSAALKIRKELY